MRSVAATKTVAMRAVPSCGEEVVKNEMRACASAKVLSWKLRSVAASENAVCGCDENAGCSCDEKLWPRERSRAAAKRRWK
jgi:hypothetical protein